MSRLKRPSNYRQGSMDVSSSKTYLSKRTRVDEHERRQAIMAKKRIVQERGLDLIALRQTFVPAVVEAFGWRQVADQALPYNDAVVREFYVMCDRATFRSTGRVVVEGRDVIITAAKINKFYDLEVEQEFAGGLPDLREVNLNADLAAALRVNGNPSWGRHEEIKQAELHFPAAFWNLFSSHSVQPTRHTSDLAIKRGRIVYCLMQGRRLNLGAIIHHEIALRSMGAKGILPFPGLITYFCRKAGVQTDPRYDFAAASFIGHKSYNGVIGKRRCIRKVERNGDFQREGQPTEPNEEEEAQVADDTDGADEFIDRGLPLPEVPSSSRMPGQSKAAPSDWQDQAVPSASHTFQTSIPPEWVQQIFEAQQQITASQQRLLEGQQTLLLCQEALGSALRELRQQYQEFQVTANARMDNLEQRMAEHKSDLRADVAAIHTQQQQHHAQNQEHQSRVETNLSYIWSTRIVMDGLVFQQQQAQDQLPPPSEDIRDVDGNDSD